MRPRLLSAFAAVSLACSLFVITLWSRSHGLGEAIEWRSTQWPKNDRRLVRTLALLTRDGQLTLAYHHEIRRVLYRSTRTRDARDPEQTTFRWDDNLYLDAPAPDETFLNRLGFSTYAESETLPIGRPRTATRAAYRYALPFWFLTLILLLPSATWLVRRRLAAHAKHVAPKATAVHAITSSRIHSRPTHGDIT